MVRGGVAVFHERHVVHVGAERNGDDRLVAEAFAHRAGRRRTRRRTSDSRPQPGGAAFRARDVPRGESHPSILRPVAFSRSVVQRVMLRALVLLGEQRRDHVHGIGVREHLVPGVGDRSDGLGRALGDHGIDHDARRRPVRGKAFEQAMNAAPDP